MKIKNLYELETESNTATGEEIATLVINLNRGLKLREAKSIEGKLYFVLEEPDSPKEES